MPNIESDYQNSEFMENIGWLDSDELDLKLVIEEPRRAKIDDDYHKTLRDVKAICQPRCKLPRHAKSNRALSAKRPEPISATTMVQSSKGSVMPPSPNWLRQKSSGSPIQTETSTLLPALSSIKSRRIPHGVCSSTLLAGGIKESDAAYHQEPEARLKLRDCPASPQKFNKAVELGIPSGEAAINKSLDGQQAQRQNFELVSQTLEKWLDNDHLKSFFRDNGETPEGSGNNSTIDSESPTTPPSPAPGTLLPSCKTLYPAADCATLSCGSNVQSSLFSSDITLRMTLTRSDLRASEEEMYGWQSTGSGSVIGSGSPVTPLKSEPASSFAKASHEKPKRLRKESMERLFASFDLERQPQQAAESTDRGFKRIWGRVRHH